MLCKHDKLKVENLGKFYHLKKSENYTDAKLFQLTRCIRCGKMSIEIINKDGMLNNYQMWKFKRMYLNYKVENIKTSEHWNDVKGMI